MTLTEIAQEVLKSNTYITLATASADGVPRATPVHFAYDAQYVYWMSETTATHSRNLAANDKLFVTVFDAGQSVGELAQRRCVYIQTRGELLSGDDELAAREIFADKFGDEDGRKASEWGFYRARIGEIDSGKSDEQRVYFAGGDR
ncbi:MAG: pyridoxamine 5'-phosphate oxidase family protein [Candidatus Saccharimonadales bacterium]